VLFLLLAVEAGFDVETFQPAPGRGAFLAVESGRTEPGWEIGAGAGVERRPLVLESPALAGSERLAVVKTRGTLDVHAAWADARWGASVALPIALQDGSGADGTGISSAATGDLRLEGRVRLLAGLAAGLALFVPTASADFAGGRFAVEPRLFFERAWARARLRGGANLSVRLAPERDFFDTRIGVAALVAAGAAEWRVPWPGRLSRLRDRAGFLGELAGEWGGAGSPAPIEARAALRLWLASGWIVDAGGGGGFGHDPLVPSWRAFALVRWEK